MKPIKNTIKKPNKEKIINWYEKLKEELTPQTKLLLSRSNHRSYI